MTCNVSLHSRLNYFVVIFLCLIISTTHCSNDLNTSAILLSCIYLAFLIGRLISFLFSVFKTISKITKVSMQ